jgi:hypothetical protein
MESNTEYEIMLAEAEREKQLTVTDAGASPFRLSIDPVMRHRLKKALFDLIDNHDAALEHYVTDGKLQLDSYKEYIELFSRCLRETMETKEGVAYLIQSCGFTVDEEEINLHPDWRWDDSGSEEL